jgi:hypothetical protein
MKRLIKWIPAALLMGGCAATDAPQPTHYWQGGQQNSGTEYSTDNQACQNSALISAADAKILDGGSDSFAEYKTCMIERGYVLRTY